MNRHNSDISVTRHYSTTDSLISSRKRLSFWWMFNILTFSFVLGIGHTQQETTPAFHTSYVPSHLKFFQVYTYSTLWNKWLWRMINDLLLNLFQLHTVCSIICVHVCMCVSMGCTEHLECTNFIFFK